MKWFKIISATLLALMMTACTPPASPHQAGKVFTDCATCPEMVIIPAGSFTMGSPPEEPERTEAEGPQRKVTVSAFALGRTEVTVGQFRAFITASNYQTEAERNVRESGCYTLEQVQGEWEGQWRSGRNWRSTGLSLNEQHPVTCVSWNDAQQYSNWLSTQTGETYRLPSEAEWEYATRAGTTGRFHTGNCITSAQANFRATEPAAGCPEGEWRQTPVPVASFSPNAFGLYDMHGSVFEWVQDCWNDSYHGAPTDGSAWMLGDCSSAGVRSGTWFYWGRYLRSAYRGGGPQDFRSFSLGFRLARSVTP